MRNTIEHLEKHIERIEAEAKKAREELERMKAVEHEWPKIGDIVFSLDSSGSFASWMWYDDTTALAVLEMGNILKTEEEAEKEIFARKVVAKLRRQPGTRGFIVNSNNYNCCITVDFKRNLVTKNVGIHYDLGWQSIYFDSNESAIKAIAAVGAENILKAATWFAMRK